MEIIDRLTCKLVRIGNQGKTTYALVSARALKSLGWQGGMKILSEQMVDPRCNRLIITIEPDSTDAIAHEQHESTQP